jgi:serine protease Do
MLDRYFSSLAARAALIGFSVITLTFAAADITAQPGKMPGSFAEITKKVEPAVVSIDTKSKVAQPVAKGTPAPGDSDDIMEFFRRQLPQRPVYVVGSGFIVDKAGYILTNAHVIDNAARISVKLDSGEEYPARVIGTDDETDLAVLKIEAGKDLPFVKLGDSDKAEVGDWVLAIGSPFGLSKTVTAGIISQTQRQTPYATAFQRFIQTDAAINRGNSGGPLVNMDGEVIGVNSQIATSTGDYNGVGFALPATEAANVYAQILKNGKVRRGYLGVLLDSVQPEFAKVYGLKDARGSIVTDVRDKLGPAAAAGIKVGDVIVDYNGQPVASAQDLISRVAATQPDQTVMVRLLRENGAAVESKTVSIKLGERPSSALATDDDPGRRKLQIDPKGEEQKPFGLTVAELTPTLAATYKLEGMKGLVVREVNPTSFIADVKNSFGGEALGEGDLIQRINRVAVTDLKSFNETVAKLKPGDAVVLHVMAYNPQTRVPQLKIVQFTVK